jgi:stage III sporulation protein SpoIIIAA
LSTPQISVADDLDLLLDVMPPRVQEALTRQREDLIEIVLDLGRPPEARYPDRGADLSPEVVTREDLDFVVERVGRFGGDNRAGIERTLHRISALRNRDGRVVGLTCRVGRAVYGTVDAVRDVVESGRSLLLLGRPGVGKTTLLREAARVLADELAKRVVVVDTSNEIAGDGDIPHSGIGRARRMQVASPQAQHAVMIEAVENHMPEVVVIDEIGTQAEAEAARTIAERGVQLIATAHGNSLDNLLQNPTLADLVGGIQAVTLSDEEARRRRTQKTVLERKAPPTFDVLIEIQEKGRLAVHHQVAEVVDRLLRGFPPRPELRLRQADGQVEIRPPEPLPSPWGAAPRGDLRLRPVSDAAGDIPGNGGLDTPWGAGGDDRRGRLRRPRRIYPYAVNKSRLERAIRRVGARARLVPELRQADLVLTTKAEERRGNKRLHEARDRGLPVYVLRSNTIAQMEQFLAAHLGSARAPVSVPPETQEEIEGAIDRVRTSGRPVVLAPQERRVRRLQHELIQSYGLASESRGEEPLRCVVVLPE